MRKEIDLIKNLGKNVVNEEQTFKPTNREPVSDFSSANDSNMSKEFAHQGINLTETDELLTEKEQSLKKKIFSLSKMESLVFSDPKLSTVYDDMAENGEEKYGYHYNETIMNIIFNDYVLNSPKYLQKYKMAIPKKKKRRDKSGINQLKKSGEVVMKKTSEKEEEPSVDETTGAASSGAFAAPAGFISKQVNKDNIDEITTTGSVGGTGMGSGGYATPAAWGGGDLMKGKTADTLRKPIWHGGTVIQESEYLTDPSVFSDFIDMLNEEFEMYNEPDPISVATTKGKQSYANHLAADDYRVFREETGIPDDVWNQMTDDEKESMYLEYGSLNEEAKSQKQRGLIFGKRNQYKSKENTPDKWKWIWDEDWENKGKLPDYVDEQQLNEFLSQHDVVEYVSDRTDETPFMMGGEKWQYVNGKYPDGKVDIAVYRYNTDLAYDYNKFRESFNIDEAGVLTDITDQTNRANAAVTGKSIDRVVGDKVEDEIDDIEKENNLNNISETESSLIGDNPSTMAFKPQPEGTLSNGGVPTGMNDMNENMENNCDFTPHGSYTVSNAGGYEVELSDSGDAARVRDAFGSDNPEVSDWMEIEYVDGEPVIDPQGYNIPLDQVMRMNETNLFEELDRELNAYSIHQSKLMKMSEDRKPSSLVLKDRLGKENSANFKSDFNNSDTKEVIDVEKELQYKDQQTDVKDPQKLGADIEKQALKVNKGEALENVGDSANDKGNEIPKRNLTTDEQDEVDLYRKGLGDYVYDNKPSERFEERMKKDMGEELYEKRQKKLEFEAGAPMYNKDTQPMEKAPVQKTQFDKDKSGWNERKGLKESVVTGRYRDALNMSHMIDFDLKNVKLTESIEGLSPIDFTGFGNSYNSKSIDNKVIVNEGVVNVLNSHKFYTNGSAIFAVKNTKSLNEGDVKKTPVVNEQVDKMKHLLSYKPNSFVNTENVKKNRGF